jgi:hypothetical protein
VTYTFRPPARTDIPRLTVKELARPSDAGTRLGRFIKAGTRSVNVWRLVDGTFVETIPEDITLIDRWFQGGGTHEVTAGEAAQLEAAGYDVDYDGEEPPPDEDETAGAGFGGEPYGEGPYGGSD